MSEGAEACPLTIRFDGAVKIVDNILVCESRVGNIKLKPTTSIEGIINLIRKKLFGWFDSYHLSKYKPVLYRALIAHHRDPESIANVNVTDVQEDETSFGKSEQGILKLNFEGVVKIEADELLVESWVGETRLSDQKTKISGETSGFVNPSLVIFTALAAIGQVAHDWLKKVNALPDPDGYSGDKNDSPS